METIYEEPDIVEPIKEVPFQITKLPEIVIVREKSNSGSSQDDLIKKTSVCEDIWEHFEILIDGCHDCYREPACCLRIISTTCITCVICVGISLAFTYL